MGPLTQYLGPPLFRDWEVSAAIEDILDKMEAEGIVFERYPLRELRRRVRIGLRRYNLESSDYGKTPPMALIDLLIEQRLRAA